VDDKLRFWKFSAKMLMQINDMKVYVDQKGRHTFLTSRLDTDWLASHPNLLTVTTARAAVCAVQIVRTSWQRESLTPCLEWSPFYGSFNILEQTVQIGNSQTQQKL
jgi:hypothetical protein